MADLGAVGEIINAKNLELQISPNTYVALQDLLLHGGRPEVRDEHTGLGAIYSYGAGEHFMTFTLTLTPVEANDLVSKNDITATGDMPSSLWLVVGDTLSSDETITFTCTGILRDWDLRKAPLGKVKLDCFVRITPDTIATAVT